MISDIILENEFTWFKSIACNVNMLSVENAKNQSSDFNFIHYKSISEIPINHTCIRLSSRSPDFFDNETNLLRLGYVCKMDFDINFLAQNNFTNNEIGYTYIMKELSCDEWCARFHEERIESTNVKYYTFCTGYKEIGKICTVITDNIVGYYDFEIYKENRNKGHGSSFLRWLISVQHQYKYHFIQTWSSNSKAIKCYIKSGFEIYEHLFRYVSKNT